MNRYISLLLISAMLLTFCACGAKEPVPVDPATPGDISTPQPPTPDTSEPPEQPIPPEQPLPSEPTPDESEVPSDEPPAEEEPEEYIREVDPYGRMVALTFDDGPHEIYSNQILDVLEANHSVATFFEVGYNVRANPQVLQRMAELGCEIASHSNKHYDLTTLSKDALLTDLATLDKAVFNATGFNPTLIRPPYGAVNSTVKNGTGRAVITWTVDTKDWMYRDAASVIDYIQNYGDLDGEIVLMHSIHGHTAEAMEVVIPWLIEQGYQLVTVSELMAYYYGELLEPNKFYNQTYFIRHDRTEYPIELPEEPMETLIPEYNTVPVVPIVPEEPPEPTPEESTPEPVLPEETPPVETPPADDPSGEDGVDPDAPSDPPDSSESQDETTDPEPQPNDPTETPPSSESPADGEETPPPADSEENQPPAEDSTGQE